MKPKLIKMKREIDKFTIALRDFKPQLAEVDKIRKDIEE